MVRPREVQHFDGDVDELELTDWYTLEVEPIAGPWTASSPASLAKLKPAPPGERYTENVNQ